MADSRMKAENPPSIARLLRTPRFPPCRLADGAGRDFVDGLDCSLAAAFAGYFTRFDVFKGPIVDNKGTEIVADGVSLEQVDLDGFKEFGTPCEICMYWWADGITAELPSLN